MDIKQSREGGHTLGQWWWGRLRKALDPRNMARFEEEGRAPHLSLGEREAFTLGIPYCWASGPGRGRAKDPKQSPGGTDAPGDGAEHKR